MRKLGKRFVAILVAVALSAGLLYEDFGTRGATVAYAGVYTKTNEQVEQQLNSQLNQLLNDLSTKSAAPTQEIGGNVGGINQSMVESAEGNLTQQYLSLLQSLGEGMEKVIPGGSKVLSGASETAGFLGTVLDLKNLAEDLEALTNLSNTNPLYQHMERQALTLDALLAVISIANVFLHFIPGGVAVSVGLASLSFLVGLYAAYLHSGEFEKDMSKLEQWWAELMLKLLLRSKTPDGVNCLKPNIYLYYDNTGTTIQVQFAQPELLTTSIPDYDTGWSVTNLGNGKLAGEEGSTYDYLFYESVTSKALFQREAGYRISAAEREEAFRDILTAMSFTPAEIEDFVEFWCRRLDDGVDYIMYPQDTATVDLAMPVTVTPEPDHMERIWFVFEQDEGQQAATPETIVLERDDSRTVIEWGGMVFDE